jgi:glycosyltransferase involved in cell wall biosynthesis
MPKLSIIIPTFNAGASIERCLRSINKQTFTDYEVVIQDGGSSDNTIELIGDFRKGYAGAEIRLYQEPDKGIYDAMNKAKHRANGEWLYFLGSDDELYEPNVVSRLLGSQDAALGDVLYGNVKVIGNAGWARDGAVYDGPFDLKKLLTRNICHQALFYRAALLRTIGNYNTRYVAWADWDLNMRCWSKTAFKYVDVIIAKFYAGGVTSQDRPDENFAADMAANVMKYFSLSIDGPVTNGLASVGYPDLVRMQHPRKLSRFKLGRALTRLGRTLKILRDR